MPFKDTTQARAANRASYRKYRTARLNQHTIWRQQNPQYMSERQLIRRYGLTLSAWDEMLRAQNNLCAICEQPFEVGSTGKHPVVDHCHNSGRIRQLLHSNCNAGIGFLKDDPALLRKALSYLEKHA